MYSKDGEYIIKIDAEDSVKVKESDSFNYWYFVLGGSLFTLVLLLFIFRKKSED